MALNEDAYIHNKAILTITSPSIDLSCMVRTVSLTPADADVDISTQCAPGATAKGITTWTFAAEFLLSFDSADAAGDGLWNQLHALAKTKVSATLKPKDAAVDSTNPSAAFDFYMPTIPFLNVATIGDKTVMPLTATTVGAPVFDDGSV